MKEYVRDLIDRSRTTAEAGCMVREYLQARVLEALQRSGAFESPAFLGGTALRFLYRLPRFSEDLDFSRITDYLTNSAFLPTPVRRFRSR